MTSNINVPDIDCTQFLCVYNGSSFLVVVRRRLSIKSIDRQGQSQRKKQIKKNDCTYDKSTAINIGDWGSGVAVAVVPARPVQTWDVRRCLS